MRNPVAAAVAVVGLCMIIAGVALSAVSTTQHATYALRPCSTCREVRYPTEQECRDAAYAEAERVGQTRTEGSAVYTCITRYNVIATFQVDSRGTATLYWEARLVNTDGSPLTNLTGYRISYGTTQDLAQTIQIASPAATRYAFEGMAPGTYYFAVRAYSSAGAQSDPSNVVSKTVP